MAHMKCQSYGTPYRNTEPKLDYGRHRVCPEVRALRERVTRAGRDALVVFLDLH